MNLLISGGIAVGKTSVALGLVGGSGGRVVRVREVLATVLGTTPDDRRTLQIEGAALDRRTGGRWLLHYLEEDDPAGQLRVVDALRTRRQTRPLLDRLADTHLVHLSAPVAVRRQRYDLAAVTDRAKSGLPFDAAVAHETEQTADEIADLAELVLDTADLDLARTVSTIRDRFGLSLA